MGREGGEEGLGDDALAALEVANLGIAFGDLLMRSAPVNGKFVDAGGHLLLETSNPLHEKFVEIGRGNGEEIEPF